METIWAPVVCFLLVLSFKAAHTEEQNASVTTAAHLGLNPTDITTSTALNSTANLTESTAGHESTKQSDVTFSTTAASAENTGQHQTSQPAATMTSPTPTIQSSLLTKTTQTIRTTPAISTSDAPASPTGNPSHSVTTFTRSVNTTEGLRLNIPERNMTIMFSGVLGLCALAIVLIVFHKCKHKIQYLHQPLNTADDTDGLVADEDTLVISGGLYDGHPIYDNVPPPPAHPSQFHLQFFH